MDMKDAAQIVDMLLETEQVRICPYCDQEHNIQVGPGQAKTHGVTCKKHLEQHLQHYTGNDPALMAKFRAMYASKPDSDFSPEYQPPQPAAAPVQ